MNEPTDTLISMLMNIKPSRVQIVDIQHDGNDVIYSFKPPSSDWKNFSFKYILSKADASLVDWDYIRSKVGYEVWGIIF